MTPDELKALIQQGQDSFLAQINNQRTDLFMSYRTFTGMNGTDNYETAIEAIVNQIGDEGVTTADLNAVFSDSKLLGKARVKLDEEKKVEVVKEKTTWRLSPIGAAERLAAAKK